MLQVRVSYRVSASTEREVCKSRNLPMHEACSGLEGLVLVPLPLSLCSQLCLLKGAFRKAGNQGKAEETHTLNNGVALAPWNAKHTEGQSQIPWGWKELLKTACPIPLLWQNHLEQVTRTMSSQVLHISKEADFMTSLGNLFHYKPSH